MSTQYTVYNSCYHRHHMCVFPCARRCSFGGICFWMPSGVWEATFYFILLFLIYFIEFLQRGRERDRKLETSMRENHRSAASCTPRTGDVPATKVHTLDRNRTWDLSVYRTTLLSTEPNQFRHRSYILNFFFFFKYPI
uniref:Uncharacterized protein n=1 Tax=Pipistrellus kuhlii TaxID=59472 RepID=A0A7J7RJL0_PIPKU|nr:hypothetical protein mPipKuh1_010536 [Pipistrellus kuhlii]